MQESFRVRPDRRVGR